MKTAYYPFRFGILEITYENSGIVRLTRADTIEGVHEPSEVSQLARQQIEEYLAGSRKTFDFPCRLKGTAFQQSVWQALRAIPYGETRSYKEIATTIGKPTASRAVGMACNKNPIWIAIPCHRVVGANGALTGYAGGLDMKKELLTLEKSYV